MKAIKVKVDNEEVGKLFFEPEKNQYGFNYTVESKPISLIMPYKNSSYIWDYKLHPIFDMNMPEGYLFEIFKQFLTKKYGYLNDFLIFSHICSNIQGRLSYESEILKKEFFSFDLDDILQNDTQDTFTKIVTTFLDKNAISGVQRKSLAILKDKESIASKEYIIKTWGEEYQQLALNEYFCLKAVEKTGVKIPNIKLSQNNKFLLVERFNYDKETDTFWGFEEILTLLGKNRDEKYSGSYEQIAKTIYTISTNQLKDMECFYKVIIMNYLLKNGDAHLKNFGMLYNHDFSNRWFSPAYDVVNTVAYIHNDRPALSMFGKKIWFGKKELIKFGLQYCYLKESKALKIYADCIESIKNSISNLQEYILKNNDFAKIGQIMIDSWILSLDEKSYKDIPSEITRNWK
ncbi:type II toxin-antitoxin system HipA family toxin [Beggiatoa leptomitoformis]|uniref:Type II toxin-antitoxin system HipA family toxin n=1 Tax=Beggiatoa leptomitoformis TaxID=288004 RepID=A0A2N9YDK3_9GAMM|nr:type II toxin-antitoxin system HipA family toxin [Beggiatoa leptomitoformis]ALG69047.1 type II toxin-antitoxin system HipA family toxin [Beggiatoa leptomitoformis]AUI68544.1 type II toxin-antitoxin system HipA family toxin [Beggiatoa leptomitoformis]